MSSNTQCRVPLFLVRCMTIYLLYWLKLLSHWTNASFFLSFLFQFTQFKKHIKCFHWECIVWPSWVFPPFCHYLIEHVNISYSIWGWFWNCGQCWTWSHIYDTKHQGTIWLFKNLPIISNRRKKKVLSGRLNVL